MVLAVDLPWLPEPPADFGPLCKAFASSDGPAGSQAQYLAGFRLNPTQSGRLSRALDKRRAAGDDFAPLSPLRLGLLASATIDLLADCIPAAAARHGTLVELVIPPYDQVMQQALDPTSVVNAARCDLVLVAVDHRWLQLGRASLSHPPAERVAAALERLRTVVDAIRQHSGAPAVLQTVPVPPQSLFGSFDRRVQGSVRAMIDEVNRGIVELAAQTGSYLVDVAALAERAGTDTWFDPVQWGGYKLPFAAEIGPAYADLIGRVLGAIRGKARKCLVLDLDNTVWGGVIGDDGMEGIKIGQGSATGEAFLEVQHWALDLQERGVILAVSSKNNDDVARRPFQEHPDMALRESHIAVFQANWSDKPSNLEAIARTLNIGIDSLVFLDDNPAERAQVRAALPMVAVPELPSDPSWYPRYLAAAGYFEAVTFSNEDRLRAASYASDAQRAQVLAQTRDLGDYLASLDIVMTVSPFDDRGRQRITQLINKTNQFNLTTRRYKETEVASMQRDPEIFTMQVRLEDKFGDLGMIAVVICHPTAADRRVWAVDTWLMSCRVLGRKVEEAMLAEVVKAAEARGVSRVIGTYIPTAKNGMVSDLFGRLGFQETTATSDGTRVFELDVAGFERIALPITLVDGAEKRQDAA